MPVVTFTNTAATPSDIFLRAIDKLASSPITGWGPTVTFLVGGAFGYEFRGTGLTYTQVNGVQTLTGGTITSISVNFNQTPTLVISGLALNAANLQAAITADANRSDNAAIETFFGPLGWNYTGLDKRDVLTETGLSSDGIALDLSGSDIVSTGGGADDFWLGAGNDLGVGGSGNDRLWGGRGLDTLVGSSGQDSLDGGADADLLAGSRGKDTMTGGTGRDTFLFAFRDGQDQITDFDPSLDRIDLAVGATFAFAAAEGGSVLTYGRFGDQILLLGIDLSETAGIVVI